MGRGRIALGLTGPFPTVTYTAHTSLVTGASPDRHGILANRPFDPKYENQAGWYWYAESIKAETLWDAARAAGKTTGAVYWPVTVGARIDDNFPQMWRAKVDEDDKLLRALMSPSLVAGYARDYPLLPAEHRTDHERGDAAEYLLRERKDDLTLVYFTDLDEAEHAHGPGSREALATLERIDAKLRARASRDRRRGRYAANDGLRRLGPRLPAGHDCGASGRHLEGRRPLRRERGGCGDGLASGGGGRGGPCRDLPERPDRPGAPRRGERRPRVRGRRSEVRDPEGV